MRNRRPIRFVLAALALAALAAPPFAFAQTGHGVQRATLDTTCAPCADFYRFANGAWLSTFKLPPSYSSYGSFDEVYDRNQERVHDLVEQLRAGVGSSARGGDEWKLGTFYGACMDSGRADAESARPLQPILRSIDAVRSNEQLGSTVASLQTEGVTALFDLGARQDFKNSEQVIAFFSQGGLGLPDRDYYTRTDSTSRRLLAEYRRHVERVFALTGLAAAEARRAADRVLALENALALASMTNVQRRDPNATWNPMSRDELEQLAPHFAWGPYFGALKAPPLSRLNVGQPRFFHALDSLLVATSLSDWRAYLRYHAAAKAAPWLSSEFAREDFAFQSLLSGEKEQQPRWKRCMVETDDALGEALGREFVKRYFTPETRSRVLAMVKNLEAALHERLAGLEWMSDSTRAQATAKLDAFGLKIGYPDRWRDYSALEVANASFLDNVRRAEAFENRRVLAKIGRPLDRTEWGMTPPTVNAYYSSGLNEIVFPAGILEPPFFDPLADDATNYGSLGTVIGHEMTHGFDDRGRKFDARGNLRDWWTPGDAERFKARAARVIDQFSGYVAVDTVHVNGRLTTGENIADLGGLAVAYRAYQRSIEGKPHPAPIDGFTAEQRFFLGHAQVWRELVRPEMQRQWTATDPHSPGRWRVNGPLSNLPEFAQAFGCRAGDAMVRPDSIRVRIW